MLGRCLYASRSLKPLPIALLDEVLEQSRRNNPRKGITCLLCFTSDIFVQVIEGAATRSASCSISLFATTGITKFVS